MQFRTRTGLLINFECAKCRNECETTKDRHGNFGRAFCNKCGAAYALHLTPANPIALDRISFGEKRMPSRTFRQRLGDLIWNRQ
jgi:hypothetical protein